MVNYFVLKSALRNIMESQTNTTKPLSPWLLIVVALALGIAGDFLLYGQPIGLGTTLFLLLIPLGLMGLATQRQQRPQWKNVLGIAGAYTFFALMLCVRDSPFITLLNLAACIYLLAVMGLFTFGGSLAEMRLGKLLSAPFVLAISALFEAIPFLAMGLDTAKDNTNRKRVAPYLRGALLALPVLLILVPLLASADANFGKLVESSLLTLLPTNIEERLTRFAFIIGAAYLLAGGLAFALTREAESPQWFRQEEENPLGFIEGSTVLGSVAGVFGLFLAVQASYLFGGAARVRTIEGPTYAEYARHGFAELVLAALVVLTLVLWLKATMRREQPSHKMAFKSLSTVVVAETLVVLLSAMQRMAAYEATYGATQTRLHVDTFIVWLGIALLWLVATLWVKVFTHRFTLGGFICALGFVASLNLLNPDARVVEQNTRRWRQNGKLDVEHLTYLSGDATPAITSLVSQLPEGNEKNTLTARLKERREVNRQTRSTWQSWHGTR
jgi:hypothetical protein